MRPLVSPLRVKLADRWRVSLRVGDGLETRSWQAELAAKVPSKWRRYEDILSGLRLILADLTDGGEDWKPVAYFVSQSVLGSYILLSPSLST